MGEKDQGGVKEKITQIMKSVSGEIKLRTGIFVLSVLYFFISLNEGMFWDNVLFASRMGNYLFEHSIFNWYIPDRFDPGHPPLLASIQVIGWKILGHHLWVSHLMMWPFVFGFLFQLNIFLSRYIPDIRKRIFGMILILADPTLSAELVLVSPEIIQLFAFFLALNAIHRNKQIVKVAGLALLGIAFFRGMMLCAGIFIYELVKYTWLEKKGFKNFFNLKTILTYLLGSIPAVIYVSWRLLTKGWLQSHPDSPWAECWQMADFAHFIKNIFLIGHRYLDFGRIFIFIFLFFMLIKTKNWLKDSKHKEIILLGISSVFMVVITTLLSTNAFGHRYFIVSYISFILLAYLFLLEFIKKRKWVYVMLFALLFSGNLWIYPREIAQGWSASLAHMPYFSLRDEAIQYIDEQDLNIEDFATFFPNMAKLDDVDLKGDKRSFSVFDGQNPYVFYSNVFNLSDEEYHMLDNYEEMKRFEKFRIKIILMKKRS